MLVDKMTRLERMLAQVACSNWLMTTGIRFEDAVKMAVEWWG